LEITARPVGLVSGGGVTKRNEELVRIIGCIEDHLGSLAIHSEAHDTVALIHLLFAGTGRHPNLAGLDVAVDRPVDDQLRVLVEIRARRTHHVARVSAVNAVPCGTPGPSLPENALAPFHPFSRDGNRGGPSFVPFGLFGPAKETWQPSHALGPAPMTRPPKRSRTSASAPGRGAVPVEPSAHRRPSADRLPAGVRSAATASISTPSAYACSGPDGR